MSKGREELRRGVRNLIEVTSREMDALAETAPPAPPGEEPSPGGESRPAVHETARPGAIRPPREDSPILRLVREPVARTAPVLPHPPAEAPVSPSIPATPAPEIPDRTAPHPAPAAMPAAPAQQPATPDLVAVHAKKGVCAAYYVNHACWEVPDAYCNQALHVCMLRDCPVYHLHQEELERRFAAKFAHLW